MSNLIDLLHAIRNETQPVEGHADPGAIQDCWDEAMDQVQSVQSTLPNVELFESLVVSAEANICRENSALVYATLAQAHATMALVEVNRRIAMILEGTVSSQKSMDPDEHNWPALNRHEW